MAGVFGWGFLVRVFGFWFFVLKGAEEQRNLGSLASLAKLGELGRARQSLASRAGQSIMKWRLKVNLN